MRSTLAFGGVLLAFVSFQVGYHMAAWELLPIIDDTIGVVRRCEEVAQDAQAQVAWAQYELDRIIGKSPGGLKDKQ